MKTVAVAWDIHPLDNPNGDKVIQLLAHPPSSAQYEDPNDYYDYWWSLLIAAAHVKS